MYAITSSACPRSPARTSGIQQPQAVPINSEVASYFAAATVAAAAVQHPLG